MLVIGAILAPGKRTVSAILRTMGLSQVPNYQTYHRVLNRAVWSSCKASHILLRHLIAVFAPTGPLIMGLDDTIERRWGKRGKRLPGLRALVDNPYTPWQTVMIKDWYGQDNYTLHITSATAVWDKTGMPAVPIRARID